MKGIILCALVLTAVTYADTLVLRNGSRVDGSFLGGDGRSIRFLVANQVNIYNVSDIESIRFIQSQTAPTPSNAPPASSPAGAYPQRPQSVNEGYGGPPGPADSAPNSAPGSGIEVPAGTQIVVRLIDAVDSERDSLGQSYRASLDQPVILHGQSVIPRGADAVATLIDEKHSGKIEGRTVLTLDLKTITVGGRTYDIVTTGVPEASASRGARSAKVIGGAAALGAIIGAAAGGGKGAAIGAGAGAGAGTAAQVATAGQRVKIPAETRLTFTLQNPVTF